MVYQGQDLLVKKAATQPVPVTSANLPTLMFTPPILSTPVMPADLFPATFTLAPTATLIPEAISIKAEIASPHTAL